MNALNYHHLYYFLLVCREGGFTKAAQKLRLSQSAVSEQVKRLESALGQKLIKRTTRSFELTEAGVSALHYAEIIFNTGSELMDFMKHRSVVRKKQIRIGALSSLSRNFQLKFLDPILSRDDIFFTITVGDSKKLIKLLRDHALDIVLSTFPAKEEESDRLYTHYLTSSPLCLVSAPSVLSKNQSTLKNIFSEYKIYVPSHALESRSSFDYYVSTNEIKLKISGELDDVALLRLLAVNEKGVVLIPRLGAINDIESEAVVVHHEFHEIKQNFYAITRQKRIPNPVIKELIRLM